MFFLQVSNANIQDSTLAGLVGGKAYQQILAFHQGFPVLNGLIVTTAAFPGRAWIAETDTLPLAGKIQRTREWLEEKGVDLTQELRNLGAEGFAVRSSATVEDMPTASFAGTFATNLNIKPEDINLAIFQVWKSATQGRVASYIQERSLPASFESLAMAVLIQPMVQARSSGIAFSHPIGDPGSPAMFISATRGLGNALVSGTARGQNYWVERISYRIVQYENAQDLDEYYELVAVIGRTIERLEVYRQCLQDIEFAFDKHFNFVLLQNRPITGKKS